MEIIDLSSSESGSATAGILREEGKRGSKNNRVKPPPMGHIHNDYSTLDSALSRLDRLLEKEFQVQQKGKYQKKKVAKGSGTGYGGSAGTAPLATLKSTEKARQSEQAKDDEVRLAFSDLSDVISKGSLTETDSGARELLEKLKSSKGLCLAVVNLLRNESLIDIGRRIELYRSLLSFLLSVSREPYTVPYLTVKIEEDSDETCSSLIAALSHLASTFVNLQVGSMEEAGGDIESSLAIALLITEVNSSLERGESFAKSSGIESSVKTGALKASNSGNGTGSSSSTAAGKTPSWLDREQKRYTPMMKKHRFEAVELCDMVSAGQISHCFIGGGKSSGAQTQQYLKQSAGHAGVSGDPRQRLVRIASEMAGLSASLPVEHGSSVFVRCDESRMDILKALIIGPEGTPYANGCFEFDIFLPPSYPNQAPKVQLVTTGQGSVRFNPNLYDCGKVCLSLLGTWSGPGWDSTSSTLLQVLVSIQSLILVPDPYFNEPGYERSQGTSSGEAQSRAYNANIRKETLRVAMLDQLRHPSPLFHDVIMDHYKLKKTTILHQLEEWRANTPSAHSYIDALRPIVEKLEDIVEVPKNAVGSDATATNANSNIGSLKSPMGASMAVKSAATGSTSNSQASKGAAAGGVIEVVDVDDDGDCVFMEKRGASSADYGSSAKKRRRTGENLNDFHSPSAMHPTGFGESFSGSATGFGASSSSASSSSAFGFLPKSSADIVVIDDD